MTGLGTIPMGGPPGGGIGFGIAASCTWLAGIAGLGVATTGGLVGAVAGLAVASPGGACAGAVPVIDAFGAREACRCPGVFERAEFPPPDPPPPLSPPPAFPEDELLPNKLLNNPPDVGTAGAAAAPTTS